MRYEVEVSICYGRNNVKVSFVHMHRLANNFAPPDCSGMEIHIDQDERDR